MRKSTMTSGSYQSNDLLPTPTASDSFTPNLKSSQMKKGSKHSINLPQAINLTSSRVAFLASLSVSPESAEANWMTVISGLKCSELSKKRGPIGSLARTLLASSTWRSTKCYLTWKIKTTKSNRLLFQLVPSKPRTGGIGSGSLPTMLPTPVASEVVGAEYTKTVHYGNGQFFRQSKRTGDRHGARLGQILPRLYEILPTPKAQDSRASYTDRGKSNFGEVVQGRTGLKLQPIFVEWMMGFPPGWTDASSP